MKVVLLLAQLHFDASGARLIVADAGLELVELIRVRESLDLVLHDARSDHVARCLDVLDTHHAVAWIVDDGEVRLAMRHSPLGLLGALVVLSLVARQVESVRIAVGCLDEHVVRY